MMESIPKQLAAALIAAGYAKEDGSGVSTYLVQEAGIIDSGTLSKWLAGTQRPSIGSLRRVCDRIGYDVELIIKPKN